MSLPWFERNILFPIQDFFGGFTTNDTAPYSPHIPIATNYSLHGNTSLAVGNAAPAQKGWLTNLGRDYWKSEQHKGNYSILDSRAGQYRDSSGAAVAYISPTAISPWSNPIIPTDQGSKAHQERLAYQSERNVNIFMAGLGFVGKGISAVKALSNLARASEVTVSAVNEAHLAEMFANGIKFTRENVLATGKNAKGQIVFLENGNTKAGLQHIVAEHGEEFAQHGIPLSKIPNIVMKAVTQGKIVGYQGSGYGYGRPIYEIYINSQPQRIAVTTGENGFIVGANIRGAAK